MNKQMEAIRVVLQMEGWRVIAASLQNTLVSDIDSLASVKRPAEISDDYLRGRISAIRDMLLGFERRIDEYDVEQKKVKQSEEQATKADVGVGSPYEKEE